MKIKYPRYTREQRLNCKLSDADIKEINRLRKGKSLLKDIAKIFKVTHSAIAYWILSPQKRKEQIRRQYLSAGKYRDRKDKRKRQSKSIKRKRKLMPKFENYRRQFKGRKI